MTIKLSSQITSLNDIAQNTHVIGVFYGEEKKSPQCSVKNYQALVDKLSESEVFKGKKDSTYFLRSFDDESPNFLFVGLGKAADVSGETLRSVGANLTKKLEAEKVKEAALVLATFVGKGMKKGMGLDRVALGLAEGSLFCTYTFDIYKTGEKPKPSVTEISFTASEKKWDKTLKEMIAVATAENEALKIARDFSNEPGSTLTPKEMAVRTQKFAKEHGVSCKVLDVVALKKEKMGALLGVGQGSANPPCLIVLEYKPKKKAKKTIAFVGKAVTFDSGGISLKPGANMEDMKHDMSGGADVIAATLLAAKLKSPNHIVCIVPAAENMPDGNAIVPSTILKTRNGKTIEVQNTDAEGRLILSDALDYAQDYNPDAIIDVATLTGAVVMALSHVAAGIMGNDDALTKKFKEAASVTEERYVELPIFPEYIDDIKSKIADIKNIGSSGAGSQKGGAFLKEFIKKGNKWLHVDIAGTAWSAGNIAYHPKHGATGHTVRTLTQFAMDY